MMRNKKGEGKMKKPKIIMITLLILAMVCFTVCSCGGDVFVRTETEKESTSSKEKDTTSEAETTKEPGSSTAKESTNEGSVTEEQSTVPEDESESSTEEPETSTEPTEPDDGKTYIYHAEMIGYDMESMARYLLGEDYTYREENDPIAGVTIKFYERLKDIRLYGFDCLLRYEAMGNLYPNPSSFAGHESISYQKVHLSCLFPEDPETKEGFSEASESCDTAAEMLQVPYSVKEVYYIDYDFLVDSSQVFGGGGPAWWEETIDKPIDERMEGAYWNEDEGAFLFIYRMENTDGVRTGTYYNENLLIILYSPKYGIMQMDCPRKYRITGKEETEVKDISLIKEEFTVWLAQHGLRDTDVEITAEEIVYSSYYPNVISGTSLDLKPYWKISFRTPYTDEELENFFYYEDIFRGGEGHSEWYIMYPAYETE